METVVSSWEAYRKAVEDKQQPRALRGAFVAGMKAALEILADPFRCALCLDRTDELAKEIEAFARQNDGK